ncbi:MAG: hypothetical protein H6708_15330 [Kofleriaceae bacterium]|nr:hypothetical protein [Myxococcales bacterium]MCB9561774.1 hypothetical protein [Kofleriaceae bacterium]
MLVSLISTSLVLSPPREAEAMPKKDEVIEVYSCDAGMTQLGTGENMQCIPNPSGDGGGGSGDPGGGDHDGPYTGGAGGSGQADALARKQRCMKCKSAAQKCLGQAQLGETTCIDNARSMAEWRCDIPSHSDANTVTAWGCSIADLVKGICAEAEGSWRPKSMWMFTCVTDPADNIYKCSGPGITNCVDSWRLSHPAGTKSELISGSVTATYEGVGGELATSVTETYSVDGVHGYSWACAGVGKKLSQHCTSAQNTCYQDNGCTAADLQ